MTNIDMLGGAFGQEINPTDPRWTPTDVVDSTSLADFAGSQNMRTLDARLTTLNAGYWTTVRLAQESLSDKMFWLRSQTPASLS